MHPLRSTAKARPIAAAAGVTRMAVGRGLPAPGSRSGVEDGVLRIESAGWRGRIS